MKGAVLMCLKFAKAPAGGSHMAKGLAFNGTIARTCEHLRLRHATAGDVRCRRPSEMAGQRFATIRQTVLDRSARNVDFDGAVGRARIECKHERETVALSCGID